ncbi:hypothetical protein BSKO_13734 [Bryopsis sp. KO-2023]|nr:hypothetical protein BSKO_13734 [Bryopsis sp. KO-2023]
MPISMNMELFALFVLGLWSIAPIDARASGGADSSGWRIGRATLYGEDAHGITDGFSIHEGSCQFGPLDREVGTGWDIAAMSDCHPDFQGSCGCCGDMDHFDISSFAFEKLAPKSEGVIGLKYRPVPCPSYDAHLPDEPENIQVEITPNSVLSSFSSTSRVSRVSTSDSTMTKHTTSVVIDHPEDSDSVTKSITSGSVTSTSSAGGAVVSKTSAGAGSVTSKSSTGAAVVTVGGSSGVSVVKVNAGERTKGTDIVKRVPTPTPSASKKKTRLSQVKAKVKAIVAGEPAAPALAPMSDTEAGQRVSRTSSHDTTSTHVHWSGWDSSAPHSAKSGSGTRESTGFVSIGGVEKPPSPTQPAKPDSATHGSASFVSIGGVAAAGGSPRSHVSFSEGQQLEGGSAQVSVAAAASTRIGKAGELKSVVSQRVSRTSSSDSASTRGNKLGGGHSTESAIPEFDVPRMG